MTKQTGFHNKTNGLKAEYIDMYGYDIPVEYKSITATDEYKAVRESVGVIDLSCLPKIEILGLDAETLCQTVFTRNIKRLGHKTIVYTAVLNEDGGMLDDGTLFRLCQNTFRFICGFEETIDHIKAVAKQMNLKVSVKNATHLYSNIAVQGPNSRKVLQKIIWTSAHDPELSKLALFNFFPARLKHDIGEPLVVSRTGYTGELGYEIWCSPRDAGIVWDAVFEAGAEFDIKPFGLNALDVIRVESGLIFAGCEFDEQTDPNEAGIRYVVPLKNQVDNFIGREAFENRLANVKKILVGLELDSEVASGDIVSIEGQQVGKITSAVFSPMLNKNIAMAFVPPSNKEIGTLVEVGSVKGKIVQCPFYEANREKMRS